MIYFSFSHPSNRKEKRKDAVSLNPVIGIPLGIGYIGADYLWQQYSGYTIRQSLNNIYYKNI